MSTLPMTEDDLKRTVLEMCATLGLLVAHFRPAKTEKGWRTPVEGDGKGFPDCVIVGPGGVLFWELKAQHRYASRDQTKWLTALRGSGARARVVWPSDLRSGLVERALKELAMPRRRAMDTGGTP